jgi:hypothetical protein
MYKVSIKSEDMNNLMALLNQIEKEPKAEPFKDPVDWKALDLQDYPKIVKRPIDLTSIKDALNKKKYETYDQFFSDIQLIWDNCKSYNIAESEIYRMAEDLERTTKKLIQKLKTRLGLNTNTIIKKRSPDQEMAKSDEEDDDEDDAEVSFDERIKFTDNVRKLKIEEMTILVRLIQEKCPNVWDDLDSDKLQIKVDDINKELFDEFMNYTRECLNKNKPKGQDIEEISKSAEDDAEIQKSEHTPERLSRADDNDDEESKGDHSIDSPKYGPEGKRVKTS